MDTTMTQQRNRLQSSTSTTNSSSASGSINVASAVNSSNNGQGLGSSSATAIISQSPPAAIERSTSSFANLLDGFTSRVSGDRQSQSSASTPSSSSSSVVPLSGSGGGGATISTASLVSGALGGASSIASLTSIGSTANAFYSSIGLAFNSLTSPITAAAAAASQTTADVVVAAASAISNHLSSPTSTTPPHGELDDEDEDCDEDDDEEDDGEDGHIPAPTPRKTWSEIKATVNEIRKQMSNLSSMVPSNIQFRTLSDGRVRCYFLSTPPNAWETTLLYTDINLSITPTTNNAEDLVSPDSPNDSGSIRMVSPPPSQASSPTMQSGFLGVGSGSGVGFGNNGKRWVLSVQIPIMVISALWKRHI